MFGRQPGAQLGQCRIRLRGDLAADRFVQVSELRRHVIALRAGGRLAGFAAPAQRFRYVGDADLQRLGDLSDPISAVRPRQGPIAQVLRISFPPPPQYAASGVWTGGS
jgi:hypothetical protein